MIQLESGTAIAHISAVDGGRVARLAIDGFDLLFTGDSSDDPKSWGSYPMVPWAGRLRHGAFQQRVDDETTVTIEMPIDMPPNAIHGTAYTTRWDVIDQGIDHAELTCRLTWPLGGRAHQHVLLTDEALVCVLSVVSDHEAMPVTIGWHPWFVKPTTDRLIFDAYYSVDDEQIPTGDLLPPPPRPWDDCFVGPHPPLELDYPHGLRVVVQSDCDHWVVYDRRTHATCVEPQSGPPNAQNMGVAHMLAPGEMLQRTMTISWR
ncbi:MAG: aldose epimerase [Ilumatobacteraceae bacterium]|nr:aldose epimerase [Ilumatobacteraceae bacterium]